MSTLLLPIPRLQGRGLPIDWSSRIVVAADGRETSDAAIAMGWNLARHSTLDIVSVLEASCDGAVSEEARAERACIVEAQLCRVLGTVPDGEMLVEVGSPPDLIAVSAYMRSASLLVIGLGTCPVRDRLVGSELALAIARRTQTPMLAVAPGQTSPPRRIVVGMDFSPASYLACEAALEIADPEALVVLANVIDATTRSTPAGALCRLVDKVQTGFPGHVMSVKRQGDPASELFDIAAEVGADTIVVGGRGQTGAMDKALGPVATRVIRCSPVSVLLVPAFTEC
jgi:nucleotide-binding universal stress UspA family protein